MDLINTENIFAWGTLIAYFTHGIITGWSYSLCFKVKVTKPVYMAIMIIATAVILVPSVCCLPRKTQKVGNHGISRNKAG